MGIVLALGAALTYGVADFIGGLVTKRNNVLTVVFLSQLLGSVALAVSFPLLHEGNAGSEALAWGALAGLAGSFGVIFLYAGLASSRMSVVAPITAVEAAAVPVVYGLLTGERPGAASLVGVVLALIAVTLVSSAPGLDETPASAATPAHRSAGQRSGVPQALVAGVSFGAFFILLGEAGADAGMMPLLGARLSSVGLMFLLVLVRKAPRKPAAGTLLGVAAAGILDVAANLLYLLATREALLSLAAVITSMYPVMTILLARIALRERLGRLQVAGLVLAAIGVVLIGSG